MCYWRAQIFLLLQENLLFLISQVMIIITRTLLDHPTSLVNEIATHTTLFLICLAFLKAFVAFEV